MVLTRASSLSHLLQVFCPKPTYIQVIDCLAKLLGRLRGRLYKHLLISMPTVSDMGVSYGWAIFHGLFAHLLNANQCAPSDLHPGNIVFANTTSHQSDIDLLGSLGEPKTSDIVASSGYSLTAQVPKYLVLPTSSPSMARDSESCQVKLVDFGEAFLVGEQRQIRCPLVFRAPEAVLTSQWDLQADIWSLGCTVLRLLLIILSFLLINGEDIRAGRRIPSFR